MNGQPNLMQMVQEFQRFKQSMVGKDPQAMLDEMIASGKVTREQVDQATKLAKQFQNLLR